jgi:LPXTG-motif cell wall-anchored protein
VKQRLTNAAFVATMIMAFTMFSGSAGTADAPGVIDCPTPEPTAVATVEPTAEPTVEPTAEPTAEPTVEPTAEPTATPTPSNTPAPTPTGTPEPTPTNTPEPPTPTPTPTNTPEPPTPTPTPTNTPVPPTPTPTPTPTNTPVPPTPTPTPTPTNTPIGPTPTATNTPVVPRPADGSGGVQYVAAVDPDCTATAVATSTADTGNPGVDTTVAQGGLPQTGQDPSMLTTVGLAAVLVGLALLVVGGVRKVRST